MHKSMVFPILMLVILWAAEGYCLQNEMLTADPQKNYDCELHRGIAEKRMQDAVGSHLSCSKDADCHSISLVTVCSDQCTVSVNNEGAGILSSKVIPAINSEICAGYSEAKCALMHPPCAPPRPPACVSGICQ